MFVNTLESLLHPRMLTIMTIDEHGFASYLHHSNRCTTSLSLGLGQSLLIKVSPLFSIRQLSMGITELGQVKGSNFLSLLNLLLIRLDLGLQLVNQSLHALMILPVLIRSIGHLLDTSLRLAEILLRISHPTGLGINLRFKLTNPSFHLVHGLLSSLESIGLGIIKPGLHILDLALKQLAVPLKALGHILLIPEFIARRAASTMAFLALSSDKAASETISSKSPWRVCISDSNFLLAPAMAWLVQVCSESCSLVSESSCSVTRRALSDCSKRVLASSKAF